MLDSPELPRISFDEEVERKWTGGEAPCCWPLGGGEVGELEVQAYVLLKKLFFEMTYSNLSTGMPCFVVLHIYCIFYKW